MPRVPFAFALTGGGDKYGAMFANADDVGVGTAVKNLILAALLTATQSPAVYGITLPPTTKQYKIKRVVITSELTTDDAGIAAFNGSVVVDPLGKVINGNGTIDFGDGLVIPAGYTPYVSNLASSTTTQFSGYVDWEY